MIEIAPVSTTFFSYDAAFIYCITCTYNNKYDWRFPTKNDDKELAMLEFSNRLEGCIWYTDEFLAWSIFPWDKCRVVLVRDKDV